MRAVVFAYHDVGVRCLRTLLAHGLEVSLVITHEDPAGEVIWYESVARHASWHGIQVLTPANANAPAVVALISSQQPDFLFSFYYRALLGPELLALPRRGAYNMHGSLLPKYRGRAPVNWAVLHGERETGATLHAMVAAADAGAIVAREAVPILPDDTAVEVFRKVSVAAELALDRSLPALLAGTAPHLPQDLSQGSYCGRRRPRDGIIDWSQGVRAVHNLIRAVAPPYPGAFAQAAGRLLRILRSLPAANGPTAVPPQLLWYENELLALCHDGALRLLEFELGEDIRSAAAFHRLFGGRAVLLEQAAGVM